MTGRGSFLCLTLSAGGVVALVIDSTRSRSYTTMPPNLAGRMDDRQPSLGLPSGITRNLANTTTPKATTRTAAPPRRYRRLQPRPSTDKDRQTPELTGPTPSWMTQGGARSGR